MNTQHFTGIFYFIMFMLFNYILYTGLRAFIVFKYFL